MSTNENAYARIEQDENSPLPRVFKIQSLLNVIILALRMREEQPVTDDQMRHIENTAGYVLDEAEALGTDFETYFSGFRIVEQIPSPSKHS